MNDRELLELIATQVGVLTNDMQEVKANISDLTNDMKDVKRDLKEFKEETNERFNILENKLDDLEVHNAERHIIINGEIRNIENTLSKVEIVTADNWKDIARMKARNVR